ncbi:MULTISPECIES: normocyte-binding protein [Paenibacillus]|uniref:Normocyte-binding protein n=1 Tax=Paenibacillus campinasensis TaxID=66347 RepID=A0A268EJN2_9BACL|nr:MULTISPECIES: normocyte-binding protein [Paenibacillus]MUG68859.1 normocyte-binding protein [Paenibacillus campinasensis]PAD73284.1 normocyte-binding protein [Paenibacillus campinasensis]PAK49387.1 normocyte-binding protein [Paenibacillus sp. 7541]
MKELVQERLGKMNDLEQRQLLKNLMTGVFLNLVDYQEEMIRKLEQRVFDELEDPGSRYDIYGAVCSLEDYDPIHEYLFPMLPSDVNRSMVDMSQVAEVIREGGEMKLFGLFLEMDTADILKLAASGRKFHGQLVTDAGSYRIDVTLRASDTYIKEIEKLYHVFLDNGVPWRTVNHPYIRKFVDCVLTGGEEDPQPHEEIREITVSLEEYESVRRQDLIPLWNIERLSLKNSGFPVPAIDRINYEHVLSLRKTGAEHGYLVRPGEEMEIRYIKRSEQELTIVTPREKAAVWEVLKVTRPMELRLGRQMYKLVSNTRRDSFAGRYAHKQGMAVRAKAEIARIVSTMEAGEGLELETVDIVPASQAAAGFTYPLNSFVSDHVRREEDKLVMRLGFRRTEQRGAGPSFIDGDLISFLVSEVQMYFPEYRCVGVWV